MVILCTKGEFCLTDRTDFQRDSLIFKFFNDEINMAIESPVKKWKINE
ncbi:hypothetical protein NU09_2499 [Flavobacterium beibuense]|uniref:Uncharacterized protein n=1 Tax=Flavobacterium beibuense TaxID=657326 RepID=A0A444W865_9FLAO|nr:hypothetical protein NU09_2499 [Flavobacterium beibuense]